MGISRYLAELRRHVGHDLLLMPSASALVVDDNGRVLVGWHRDLERWVLPGGAVDPAEEPADAAVREVWEETGVLVQPVGVVAVAGGRGQVITYLNRDVVSYVDVCFLCRPVGGDICPDEEEMPSVEWADPDVLLAGEALHGATRMAIDAWRSGNGTAFTPAVWRPAG